ncbi:lipase family protein [Nocardia sp. NPDC058658]|uniref:lipase family protein n=1 Tax=Nocardia sp. NPDC058658 TaxID=3346580 RepID=UPI003650BA56
MQRRTATTTLPELPSESQDTLSAGIQKEISLLGQFMAAGAAVAVTDFDGKKNTIMSPSEGRMVLDGIRAAKRGGLGLEASPVGLWGYSGGGNSSASAALNAELAIDNIARTYCERGVHLRMFEVPATEHISAEIVPELGTVAWLLAVTAGADAGPRAC